MLSIIRRVGLVLLALIFFLLLIASLTLGAVDSKILNEDFYKDQLEENDFYARVYTDVMPEIEAVPDYYGSLQISSEEVKELTAQIFPPRWLKAQVEELLDDLLPWLRSDTDDLNMSIDLGPIKQDAHSIIMAFLRQKIDAIPDCQPGQMPDLSSVSQGKLPECIPGGPERNIMEEQAISQAMAFVNANIELAPDTIDLVEEAKGENETRQQFLNDFDTSRQVIRDIIDIPQAAFYGAMAAVLGIIALLNMRRWQRALRWLGGTMFFSGLPLVAIFAVATFIAPDRVADAVSEGVNDVPAAINTLLRDIVSSGIKDLTMGFILPAAVIMGLGLLCFVASFVPGRRNHGNKAKRNA